MDTPAAHRPSRTDARQNRERIIDAARALFLEHGAAVEMRQVAESAGVGIGTIYRNFPAKSDLVLAVATAILDETDRALSRVLQHPDPRHAIAAYIRTLAETFARTSPLAMDLMATPAFEELRRRVLSWFQDPRLETVVQRGIELGYFRFDLHPPAARLFIAGAADPLVIMAAGPGPLPAHLTDGIIDLVLRALLAPRPAPPPLRTSKVT